MKETMFGFIGTGCMGSALARAAARAVDPQRILLANRSVHRAEHLAEELGCVSTTAEEVARSCKFLFLGVKPQNLHDLAGQIVPILSVRRERFVLVSMAAGVSMKRIQTLFNGEYPVVRICPNTPAAIGRGLIAWCCQGVTSGEMDELTAAMSAAGVWDELSEELMDVASIVGGATPAYAYMFMEALADGAVRCGMPRQKALRYAAHAVEGAAALLLDSREHPGALKDAVCSPGGSTIVGVNALEEHGFRAAAMDAVCAAVERNRSMGK